MFIAFNIIVIAAVGIIAYWWANQGLFSALLHFLCVVAAGAIALAWWEPLTQGVLLRGSFFDDYAWGVSLVVLFAVSLFILRLVMDKLAPANVAMPHWADLAFGGALGLCSGVLSIGILLIGIGHLQSSRELLGWEGWARSERTGEVVQRNALWFPVHRLTSNFYGFLSANALRTRHPLLDYEPGLWRQATLVRDTFNDGRGKVSLRPSAATIEKLSYLHERDGDHYFVRVRFTLGAIDFGEQLTLSASQIRLIGQATGKHEAPVAHPIGWRQYSGYHHFDNISHYITSQPGKESTTPEIEFKVPAGFVPEFIEIRRTRYALPQAQAAPPNYATMGGTGDEEVAAAVPVGGTSIQSVISISNSIRPVSISTNVLPASIEEQDHYLTSGMADFPKRGERGGSRKLRIEGIYEPDKTFCVRLDVSRGGPADIFRLMEQVPSDATLALVDSRGSEYTPIGYFYDHGDQITIKLEPTTHLRHITDLPILPTSGDQKLDLLFYVTEGVTITGFRFGSVDVGYCNLLVEGKHR